MLSGGAGSRAIDTVFRRRWGIDNAFNGIQPHGQTDPNIFRELFRKHELRFDDEDAVIRELADEYRDELVLEMPVSVNAVLMPGVTTLLSALSETPGVVLGLLTGNFEPTARIKLARFDLNRYFPFGAFSTDGDDRVRLTPIAVARAEARIGRPIGLGPHVAVIGDTPNDVRAAVANGCTSIAVATTKFSIDNLRDAGAHHVFPDLSDTRGVLAALDITT